MRSYPKEIPGLTSLRFVAALWIVLLHYVWWLAPAGGSPPVIPIISQGGNAVDFFFVLSGFILTHAYYGSVKWGKLSISAFAIKRFARIYPLHIATLFFYLFFISIVVLAGLKLPNPDRYTANTFFIHLTMLQAFQFTDTGSWNFPSWSISAEWFAYALFPVLAAGVVRHLAGVPALALLVTAYGLYIAFYALAVPVLGIPYFEMHAYGGWYRILPEFVLGIALYRVGVECEVNWLGKPCMILLLAGSVVAAAAFEWQVATVTLLALTILATAEASRRPSRSMLNSPLLAYLGSVSFALYMVHLPVATIVFGATSQAFGNVSIYTVSIAVAVAVVASMGANQFIEKPAYRFIVRQLARRITTKDID